MTDSNAQHAIKFIIAEKSFIVPTLGHLFLPANLIKTSPFPEKKLLCFEKFTVFFSEENELAFNGYK